MNKEIISTDTHQELAADTSIFTNYLSQFGLPTDNIIASTDQRLIVSNNLPQFLDTIPNEEKKNARYLSKFIGATAIGLFDAALNYLWNEVVINLRTKAIIYGIDLFFDAAVSGNNRANYKTEDDLSGLKDRVLLDTCRKLELISDIVFRKLDYILTMRNEVAASHPNVESIGGYELLGWLQTCVKDVIQDKPSSSAIQIKKLVDGLKARQEIIDDASLGRITQEVSCLSSYHVQNLLMLLFRIYVDPATNNTLRKNVALLSPSVWNVSPESIRYKIGVIIDGYRTNLQNEQLNKGKEFLRLVNGEPYETIPSKVIILSTLIDKLSDAHNGFDNFYTEPPIMREILRYFQKSSDIPSEILSNLINIILCCRIGRGVSYYDGVSPAGKIMYDKFLSLLDEEGILVCLSKIFSPDVNYKLSKERCKKQLQEVLELLQHNAISDRVKEILEYVKENIDRVQTINKAREFRTLWSPYNERIPLL